MFEKLIDRFRLTNKVPDVPNINLIGRGAVKQVYSKQDKLLVYKEPQIDITAYVTPNTVGVYNNDIKDALTSQIGNVVKEHQLIEYCKNHFPNNNLIPHINKLVVKNNQCYMVQEYCDHRTVVYNDKTLTQLSDKQRNDLLQLKKHISFADGIQLGYRIDGSAVIFDWDRNSLSNEREASKFDAEVENRSKRIVNQVGMPTKFKLKK